MLVVVSIMSACMHALFKIMLTPVVTSWGFLGVLDTVVVEVLVAAVVVVVVASRVAVVVVVVMVVVLAVVVVVLVLAVVVGEQGVVAAMLHMKCLSMWPPKILHSPEPCIF